MAQLVALPFFIRDRGRKEEVGRITCEKKNDLVLPGDGDTFNRSADILQATEYALT